MQRSSLSPTHTPTYIHRTAHNQATEANRDLLTPCAHSWQLTKPQHQSCIHVCTAVEAHWSYHRSRVVIYTGPITEREYSQHYIQPEHIHVHVRVLWLNLSKPPNTMKSIRWKFACLTGPASNTAHLSLTLHCTEVMDASSHRYKWCTSVATLQDLHV